MEKVTTAARLKQIMQERNIKQVDILELCKPYCIKYNEKLGKSILSQYISGSVEPGQAKLAILGLALNVNEVWLMGYDVQKERDNSASSQSPRDDEQELLTDYRALNDLGKQEAQKRVNELTKLEQYKKADESDDDEYETIQIAARHGNGENLELKKKKGKSLLDMPDYGGRRR